ncbi:unnamed protein product [Triticum turgidum subsp. durum]|uniref:TF-B3 domain-containing protein n=1 Tax=Triticum turgidum subsp. durum TaxID=4567 RepID=A0A9R1ACR8_TRITD|nr:unnamed protein product [Triticum turgidum subsp. durum]
MEPAGCDCGGGAGAGGWGCEMDGCEECVAWWMQHCYWNHATGGRRQFIVRASDGFRDGVCIPQEAARQLRNMLPESEPIKLEAPDGHMYDVEFRKFGGICLATGWLKFVDANHIQEGDSILFDYCGGSSFKVHIFTSSAGHESSQQPPDIFTAVPPSSPLDCVLNEQVGHHPVNFQRSTEFGYTTFPGTCVTQAQEKKVLELAENSMRSEFPLHVAAVNKRNTNEDCYVYIPLRLLDNFTEEITIQLETHGNNTLYSVGASKHSDDQIILQSGLNIFVASHHIQENDLIIFRSKGKDRLDILVLDPSGCEKASCFAMGDSSNLREVREDSVEIVDKEQPPPTVIDLSSDDDEVMGEDMRKSCRSQKAVPAHKTHDRASGNLEVGVGPSQRPYILSLGVTLPKQVEKKVEEKVQSILSELPIFVKVMTISCIDGVGSYGCALSFCQEYICASLRGRKGTLFLQLEGRERKWRTNLSVGGKSLTSGWKEFATDNNLEVGDVCLFQMQKGITRSHTMTVYLIRKWETEL